MKQLVGIFVLILLVSGVWGQGTQPLVAIHDSELNRSLDSSNSPAIGPTPTGPGTTGLQWWPTNWHYFVMPESVKEILRSDGTAFRVIGDSNITAGVLLTNGFPKYPILISLAAEAVRDNEIAPLTNYVAAGGFLFLGSSAFTRNTNGTSRGDFALGNEMGIHAAGPGLTNWVANNNFTKQTDHRLVDHIPGGQLSWRLPTAADETTWGISPSHPFLAPHLVWRVQATNALVLGQGDGYPFLCVRQYGQGYFIYCAAMQPLVGHGGFAPTLYSYLILRRAIEWAFETRKLPIAKVSPWPFKWDAAFTVRHDLENFTNEIAAIEASARFEFTNGARGDYYFCTGTLRDDASPAYDPNTIIAGLRSAVTNYGAKIGSHNGGLVNPNNPTLVRGQYDYWHWGPDEALDVAPTNFPSGKAYATASISNSFKDIEGWLSGINTGVRCFSSCYFNGTREDSYLLQQQLNVRVSGDQKVGPFPHWTISTRTPGKRYPMLSEPVSDWFVGGLVAQSLEPWHPPGVHTGATMREAVDFYYNLGGLVAMYSHTLSTGLGDAGSLAPDYITYSLNTNLHSRLWPASAMDVYNWWVSRSNAQITVTYTTNGHQSITTCRPSGSGSTNLAVELLVPGCGSAYSLQVFTNTVLAGASIYRTNGQVIKVRVGTAVTNAEVRYVLGPRAQDDQFSFGQGTLLNVAAPGVLANDARGNSTSLVAVLLVAPTNGTLVLSTNGGFTYTPTNLSATSDTFAYQAVDELTNASTAIVLLNMISPSALFQDDFTRPAEPGSLSPWLTQSGNWTVSGGVLKGGTNTTTSYGSTYITNSWSNYTVQARIQFPAGAFGGGVAGRVAPGTGRRYAAWIYPEGSAGGSNLLKLIKFSSWTTFGYNNVNSAEMQQVNLAAVGTNWHDVKLAFISNQIAVYFDGVQMMSFSDVESEAPYYDGSVSVDFWTDVAGYRMNVDDVVVNRLVADEAYEMDEDTTLTIAVPGVLGNDTAVFTPSLQATVVSGATNGTLSLSLDGSFAYSPATNFIGEDHFSYLVLDGATNLGIGNVTININAVNDPPELPSQPDLTILETSALTITNTAADPDVPPDPLSYVLVGPPPGAQIDANGVITWTPGEAAGPGAYTFTTVVTDHGTPSLTATNSFSVTVIEVNEAPVLPSQVDRTVSELSSLVVTNAATDSDVPANGLSYALVSPQPGAAIDSDGVITWTPTEAEGPSTNLIVTVVTDNGFPFLSATNAFHVVVLEVNRAPVVGTLQDVTIEEFSTLIVTNTAVDSDIPSNILSYVLLVAPTNAAISPAGVITWTPTEEQGPSTNTFMTVVTDDGTPALSATNHFVVVTTEVNSAPVLQTLPDRKIAELSTLVVTNTATDSDYPANNLTYVLVDAPPGAVIDTNGVITWMPSEEQGPGTNVITTIVSDDGFPILRATNSFTVTVSEVNSAPLLSAQANRTVAALRTLVVTNVAADTDLPSNELTYALVDPPAGASIDAQGVIRWSPAEGAAHFSYVLVTQVIDNGLPPLGATNTFFVNVTDPVAAPVILNLSMTTTNETIEFTTTPGYYYRLEYSEDLTLADWVSVFPEVLAEGATTSLSHSPPAETQRYYRIVLLP